MPKRKLFPDDDTDRRLLIGGEIAFLLLLGAAVVWVRPLHWYFLVILAAPMPLLWIVTYLFQELPQDDLGQYTTMIADIEIVGQKLNQLAKFLKQERERVLESEATLRTLEDEKTRLEPVVVTQREAVNAILSAYTKNTASRIWKERAIRFVLGLLASLIAGVALTIWQ